MEGLLKRTWRPYRQSVESFKTGCGWLQERIWRAPRQDMEELYDRSLSAMAGCGGALRQISNILQGRLRRQEGLEELNAGLGVVKIGRSCEGYKSFRQSTNLETSQARMGELER